MEAARVAMCAGASRRGPATEIEEMKCQLCERKLEWDDGLELCEACLPAYSSLFSWLGDRPESEIRELWTRFVDVANAEGCALVYGLSDCSYVRIAGLIKAFITEALEMAALAGDVAAEPVKTRWEVLARFIRRVDPDRPSAVIAAHALERRSPSLSCERG